jgi:hypothetical protein
MAPVVLWPRDPNIILSLGRIHPDKSRRDVCATAGGEHEWQTIVQK